MTKLILILFIFSYLRVQAFTLATENTKGFKSEKIQFHINRTNCPTSLDSYVKEALDFWNYSPHTYLKLELASDVDYPLSDIANYNFTENVIIYCSVDLETETGEDANSILGFARSVDVNSDNYYDRGRFILNYTPNALASFTNVNETYKKITLAHEIGHILGLGHTSEENALMYFDVGGKTEINLHQDDIDGIQYLYPQSELQGDYFLGCASIGTQSLPPNPWSHLYAILILLFPLILKLRFPYVDRVKNIS